MGKVEEKDMPAAPVAPTMPADDAAAQTPAIEDTSEEEMKNI